MDLSFRARALLALSLFALLNRAQAQSVACASNAACVASTANVATTISPTTIFTPSVTGFWQVFLYAEQIDVGSGCAANSTVGTIALTYADGATGNVLTSGMNFTDNGGSTHAGTTELTLGFSNTTGTTSQIAAQKTLYFSNSHAVQYSVGTYTATGNVCTTNPNYRLWVLLQPVPSGSLGYPGQP